MPLSSNCQLIGGTSVIQVEKRVQSILTSAVNLLCSIFGVFLIFSRISLRTMTQGSVNVFSLVSLFLFTCTASCILNSDSAPMLYSFCLRRTHNQNPDE